jgi:hypothetical protein
MDPTELPPELQGFASFLDAQSGPVRDAFAYCLCLMMVEVGKMRLIDTLPGESSPICVFETSVGDTFSVPRPPMDQEEEAKVIAVLRDILKNEGML